MENNKAYDRNGSPPVFTLTCLQRNILRVVFVSNFVYLEHLGFWEMSRWIFPPWRPPPIVFLVTYIQSLTSSHVLRLLDIFTIQFKERTRWKYFNRNDNNIILVTYFTLLGSLICTNNSIKCINIKSWAKFYYVYVKCHYVTYKKISNYADISEYSDRFSWFQKVY